VGKRLACSVWGAECSFYSGERWQWGGAGFAMVAVGPGLRRAKAWARTVAGALAKMTRVTVMKKRHYSGGECDGSLQVMAEGRGCSRRLRRSRGPGAMSRRCRRSSCVDWW
jgi:hypothetical protein